MQLQASHHQNAATAAGFGGPGFLMFAKYMEWHVPDWAVIIIGLASAGLLAYSAIVYAGVAWTWCRKFFGPHSSPIREVMRRNLIPLMLSAIAVAAVLLLAVAIGGTVLYRSGYFDPTPSEIIVRTEAPKVTAAQALQGPLIPNMPPALPAGMCDLVGRFIQLAKGSALDIPCA